jgi:MFS superfamily sulfate permease-like transporter
MGEDSDGNKMEVWMVFMAILPAIMLLILFFFDHNVSSIMAQDPKFNLQKPSAYNLDFAVLGVSVVLCGVFGVPPGNGLIPQAPLHVRALAVVEYEDTPGGKREVYTAVVEKRWSNLLQSVLVLITAFLFPVLKLIPQAVLSGKDYVPLYTCASHSMIFCFLTIFYVCLLFFFTR